MTYLYAPKNDFIMQYASLLRNKLRTKLSGLGHDDDTIHDLIENHGPNFASYPYINADKKMKDCGLITMCGLAEYLLSNPMYGLLLSRNDEDAVKRREAQEDKIVDYLVEYLVFKLNDSSECESSERESDNVF